MGFTDDDRILIENLNIFKGYGTLKSFQFQQITELFEYFAGLFCIALSFNA